MEIDKEELLQLGYQGHNLSQENSKGELVTSLESVVHPRLFEQ